MKKIYIFFLFILFALIVYFMFRGQNNIPESNIIFLPTDDGKVQVRNFYKSAVEINRGSYAVIKKTNSYKIMYLPKDNAFLITIFAQPIFSNISQAEIEFLNILGIELEEACKLKVVITVSSDVDTIAAGKDLSLSFCRDGKFNPLFLSQ